MAKTATHASDHPIAQRRAAPDARHEAREQQQVPSRQAPASGKSAAVQAGARTQPVQMPAQHLSGQAGEGDLELQPRFMAPDYKGSQKLLGRVALITGGDSGIGRAVAVLFAREGADVAVAFHSSPEDAQTTRRHVEEEGQRCLLLQVDVKNPVWCEELVNRTVHHLGGLDILVNNAAVQKHEASIEDIDDERLRDTWDTNLGGYFRLTRAALPHLKPGASIINTGSVVGLRGSAHLLDYAATKGAIHAFTKSLASNLLDRGIRVNAVAPGPVWTPLNPADLPADQVAGFGRHADMGRPAQPEELSPAYVFLAAPSCSGYITGIVLPVTGSVEAI